MDTAHSNAKNVINAKNMATLPYNAEHANTAGKGSISKKNAEN